MAIDQASAGDEVLIPAGTCTWTQTLIITKSVTLRGGGAQTVLRDGVTKMGVEPSQIMILKDVGGFRLTDFVIEGAAPDPGNYNKGHMTVEGDVRGFRIDHLVFRSMQTSGIVFWTRPIGLVDHCSFSADFEAKIVVHHHAWDGGWEGDSSWASPSTLGTLEALYVEDSEFIDTGTGAAGGISSFTGARMVIRNNRFTGDGVFAAGPENGRARSTRHVEVYANRFVTTQAIYAAITIGGGTGVVFDNVFEGPFSHLVRVEALRTERSFGPFGMCTGTNPFDENSQASGYACIDSVGRGQGELLGGDPPLPAAWPRQRLDPLYLWGNTVDGGLVSVVSNRNGSVIVAGRDSIEGTPRPGYRPVDAPHPLQRLLPDGGSAVPDAGSLDTDGGTTTDGGLGPTGARWRVLTCSSTGSAGLTGLLLLLLTLGRCTEGELRPTRRSKAAPPRACRSPWGQGQRRAPHLRPAQ
jgi:hypothetical protein